MIIDMHAHLHTNVLGRVGDERTVLRNIERGLIDRAVVSSLYGGFYPTLDELHEANRQVYRFTQQHPTNILGYCYVNPMLGGASLNEFRHCIEDLGMVGMKWWVAVRANDRRSDMFFAQAAEYRVPVLIHAWIKATGNAPGESFPDDVRVAAQRFPETTFLMAHRGGDWQYGKKAARGMDNIYVDIGGPHEMGIVEEMVADVGADHLVLGTDNVDASRCIGMVRGAQINEQERAQILGGTAQYLLSLRQPDDRLFHPELNALEPIGDPTRLIIGDALNIARPGWQSAVTGDSIFMSFDPVAHDAAGLQLYREVRSSEGHDTEPVTKKVTLWLENAAELGLGTNDPDSTDLVEVNLT